MKSKYILYIVLLICFVGFGAWNLPKADAAFGCQILYGGGQVCQGQTATIKTYPPTPTPTPEDQTQNETVPPTSSLPSTGTASWTIGLLGVAGVAGVLLLLL